MGAGYRYSGYGGCPRHPLGGCNCASLYPHPAHPAHPTRPQQHALDHFVRPPPPADPADIMQTGNNNNIFLILIEFFEYLKLDSILVYWLRSMRV